MNILLQNKKRFLLPVMLFLCTGIFAQPANDDCSNAISITEGADCTSGVIDGATTETNEVTGACGSGSMTAWYSFVPTSSNVDVSILGTASCHFSSNIWDGSTGCPPTSGSPISCYYSGNGASGTLDNLHELTGLTVGDTYYIQIVYSSAGGCKGDLEHCVSVLNQTGADDCADAYDVTAGELYSTTNAGTSPDKDLCSGSTENNVWFQWTVPGDWNVGDTAFVHLFNQECNFTSGMQLSVFEAGNCGQIPDPAGTGDCAFYANTQTMDDIYFEWIPASIGATYYFDVDGYGGTACNFDFMVSAFKCLTLGVTSTTQASCGGSDGTASVIASNSTPPYTFSWSPTNGGTVTSDDTSSTLSNIPQGDYRVTITDADGCETFEDLTVMGPVGSDFTFAGDSCGNPNTNNIQFTHTGYGAITGHEWDFGDGSGTSTSQDPSYSYGGVGTYTVTHIVTDGTCSDTTSYPVQIVDCTCPLTVDAGNDTSVCDTSGAFTLNGNVGGAGGCDGTLTDCCGSTTLNQSGGSTTCITIGDNTSGGYVYINFSDISIDAVNGGNYDYGRIRASDGGYISFNDESGATSTFIYDTDNCAGCSNSTTDLSDADYIADGVIEVCIVENGGGASSLSFSWTTVNASGDTLSGCSPSNVTYSWSPNDGNLSDVTILDPTFTPPDVASTTEFKYYLSATDPDIANCTKTDSILINVLNCEPCGDPTPPYIIGSSVIDTSEYLTDSTFRILMSEPIQCGSVNGGGSDFELDCSSTTTTTACNNNSIASAICDPATTGAHSSDDTSRWIIVEMVNPVPTEYNEDWKLTISGIAAIMDTCNNSIADDPSGGGDAIILPVELVNFSYKKQNGKVLLSWSTATEANSAYFAVERSSDGKRFEEIARVHAAGTSTTMRNYNSTDDDPYNGMNYYRLKLIDKNGEYSYTNILAVKFDKSKQFAIQSLKPVPARESVFLDLTSDTEGEVNYHVYDLTGKMLIERNVKVNTGLNKVTIDLNVLKSGVYLLSVEKEGEILRSKFIKY